jgi:uncharacterized membrane protein
MVDLTVVNILAITVVFLLIVVGILLLLVGIPKRVVKERVKAKMKAGAKKNLGKLQEFTKVETLNLNKSNKESKDILDVHTTLCSIINDYLESEDDNMTLLLKIKSINLDGPIYLMKDLITDINNQLREVLKTKTN